MSLTLVLSRDERCRSVLLDQYFLLHSITSPVNVNCTVIYCEIQAAARREACLGGQVWLTPIRAGQLPHFAHARHKQTIQYSFTTHARPCHQSLCCSDTQTTSRSCTGALSDTSSVHFSISIQLTISFGLLRANRPGQSHHQAEPPRMSFASRSKLT